MESSPVVTFLSDFGDVGGYVAACELVVTRIAPSARVVHLSHTVPPGDILTGSLLLARLALWGPVCVHLVVIDPGVGTERRAVCLSCRRGDLLVGPDNGVLLPAARSLGGIEAAWSLSPDRVHRLQDSPAPLSRTFHGRDVFAPAAALLAAGEHPAVLGDPLDPDSLVEPPLPELRIEQDSLTAVVTEIDTFGNIQLAVPWNTFTQWLVQGDNGDVLGREVMCRVRSSAGETLTAPLVIVRTFVQLSAGKMGLLEDSWGSTAVVAGRASAARLLGIGLGATVELMRPAGAHSEVRA